MAGDFADGILQQFDIQGEVINDVSAFLATQFVPETPLTTLLSGRTTQVGSQTFKWRNRKTRPRANTVGTGGLADASATSLPVADASMYMVGDVLEIESERVEVTADPDLSATPNTVTIKRGVEGTTAAAHTAAKAIKLIGNSRTGGEIDQSGLYDLSSESTQYVQVFQFPVQVSGSANSSTNLVLPPGFRNPFSLGQAEAMRNMKRDIEHTSYYGIGEAPSSGGRPKQKGLRKLITTNLTTSPTNASAYKPADFIADTIQKCRDNGGDPNAALVSTGFLSGLAKWGMNVERTTVGQTALGTPIVALVVPFITGRVMFFEAQQLGSGTSHTACVFNIDETFWRSKRNPYWKPRGSRGDAEEGEFLAEGAIQLINEAHHAWVEGITGWSA